MTSWREEQRPVDRIERVGIDELAARAEADPGLQILDVRGQGEWDAGHIPGSVHTPYHDVDRGSRGPRPGSARSPCSAARVSARRWPRAS